MVVVAAMAAAVAAMVVAVEATAAGAAVDVATAAVVNVAADRPRGCAPALWFPQAGSPIPSVICAISRICVQARNLVESTILPYR